MKPALAIALVIGGVVLICVPPASTYLLCNQLLQAQQTIADSPTGMPTMSLPIMSDEYRVACFVTGVAMIGVAVMSSRRKCGAPLDTPVPPATH